ncbi:hypothetical protein P2318_02230 [Myxococcaceae bacterium GXIMD 01537]
MRAQGPAPSGTAAQRAPTPAEVQQEVAQLRAEVARLQKELADMRRTEGTGGSGGAADTEDVAVASVEFVGRVQDVSRRRVNVVDRESGDTYVLLVDEDTRALRGGRRIPVRSLREGSTVRASYDLVSGEAVATRIQEMPRTRPAAPSAPTPSPRSCAPEKPAPSR